LISAVDAAQHEVRLETYIFHFDVQGIQVAEALERAALRGVAVYLVMDGVGTPDVPLDWQHRWNASGVRWHQYALSVIWACSFRGAGGECTGSCA